MKKVLVLSIAVAISLASFAQKEYSNVNKFFFKSPVEFENAKIEVDKLTADPKLKDKPETYLWQARVYAGLFADASLRAKNPKALSIASEAFDKYMAADPEAKILLQGANMPGLGFTVIDQIRITAINTGLDLFKKQQWSEAYDNFKYAAAMGVHITKRNWNNNKQAIDTISVLYTAYAAQNAKKIEDAIKYYSQLADLKIVGDNYLDMYKYILVASSDKKDSATFYKYYPVAKQVYPNENWEDYQTDFMNKNFSLDQKAAFYDKKDASNELTATQYYHFGDMFNSLTKEEKAKEDSEKVVAFQHKGAEAFKKAFNMDKQLGVAAFNAGIIYYLDYNNYDDLQRANIRKLQEINTQKANIADPKKKLAFEAKFKSKIDSIKAANIDIDKKMMNATDVSIEWLENCYKSLKDKEKKSSVEKSCLGRSVDFLATLYDFKKRKVQGKDLKAYDIYEAKYKEYDALHGKF